MNDSAGQLAGKVAIVTGGAGGLGRGMVELFVAEGAQVVIADVDAGAGDALAKELGSQVVFERVDVADAEQVQAAVDVAVDRFGGLDVMCNNAGVGGTHKRFLDDDFSDFDRVMAVNVFGVMIGTQRAARRMAEHGGGSIVNITSIGGINAGGGVMAYRASKAAVIHLTRSVAVELAPKNVRVNCIAPAHIPTAMNATFDQAAIVRAMQPLQRMGSPRDVAEAALFLASDRAAQITGIVMPVDGGTTAGPRPRSMKDLLSPPPRTVSVSGLDHASLPMRDTAAMVAFYRALGFDVEEQKAIVAVHAGEQMINFHRPELWPRPGFTLRAPEAVPPCGDLCFVWDGDTGALHALLEGAGAAIEEGPVARVGGRRAEATSVYVRDPDGNLLEFMIYPEKVERRGA